MSVIAMVGWLGSVLFNHLIKFHTCGRRKTHKKGLKFRPNTTIAVETDIYIQY